MRGQTARRLRRIARELKLAPKTEYAFGGPLMRKPSFRDPRTGEMVPGAPIPRPIVMRECFRKAYQEAKKLYLGRPWSKLAPVDEKDAPYHARVVNSMRAYMNEPNT